jgi:hypothetical protein
VINVGNLVYTMEDLQEAFETMQDHAKSCEKCINEAECDEDGANWDVFGQRVRDLHKLVQFGNS